MQQPTKNRILTGLALIFSMGFSGASSAELIDRGGGLLYDDVLNVTWLQDANYAKTSGYSFTGEMSWNEANTWANNLVYAGYDDWRLARNAPVNGIYFSSGFATDGTLDDGYNITSPHSELAYMYHVNLALKSAYAPSGIYQSDWGAHGDGTYGGQANIGLVHNLQAYYYWSGTTTTGQHHAWTLYPSGYQSSGNMDTLYYAWAVRPGDVAAVPIPGTVWLFGSCLGIRILNRYQKKSKNPA